MNLIASKIKELRLVLNQEAIKPIKMDEDSFIVIACLWNKESSVCEK